MYRSVPGANARSVIEQPDPVVRQRMCAAAAELADAGCKALTTSCGFNAIAQADLAGSVTIPLFSSALIQIPWIRSLYAPGCRIGVITARSDHLRREHFTAVGVEPDDGLIVVGLETMPEWSRIFSEPDREIDVERIAGEVLAAAAELADPHRVDAILLECTDLPPFSARIRTATRRPVFDLVTLGNFVAAAVADYDPIL